MKFSIITPSFNQGKFLAQTIESVLSQEGDFEIEYFVFDGGSTDQSVSVLKDYEKRLGTGGVPLRCKGVRFFWASEKDTGQSNAINKGLRRATGEILAWINSDDWYEAGAFARVEKFFREHPDADLVYGNIHFADERGTKSVVYTTAQMDLETLATTNTRVYQPAAFFSKRIIDRVGMLDESLHFVMDYDLWLRIFKEGRAFYLPETLANFRRWEDSKTMSKRGLFTKEMDVVHKKYGLTVLNPRRLKDTTSREPFVSLQKYAPWIYGPMKTAFYFLAKKVRYRKK